MRRQPHNGLSPIRGSFMENETNLNSNGKYQIRLNFSTYRRRSTRLESWPKNLNSGLARTVSVSRLKGLTAETRGFQITSSLALIPFSILCRAFQRQNKVYSYQTNQKNVIQRCYLQFMTSGGLSRLTMESFRCVMAFSQICSPLVTGVTLLGMDDGHTSILLGPFFYAHVVKIYSQNYLTIRRKGSNFSTITFKP